mgnify:CR=1 FL=1
MQTSFVRYLSLVFVLIGFTGLAQEKQNDTIKTDELIITKKYSPTVNDAFKIKPKPQSKDTSTVKRSNIDYSIINIPVASTFTPSKGKASNIERQPRPQLYDNYASLGAGSFANIIGEFYGNIDISRNQELAVSLDHFSSSGGVDGILLDDDFVNSQLGLDLITQTRYYDWNAYLKGGFQSVNWYGINNAALSSITENEFNSIDPAQSYMNVNAGGSFSPNQSFLDQALLDYSLFSDDFSNTEHFINLQPEFNIYFLDQLVETDLQVDYVSGSFSEINSIQTDRDYSFLNLRLYPHLLFEQGGFSADLGAQVVYNSDVEQSNSDIYVYPKVNLNYEINDANFVAFAGAKGNLEQNRYQSFVDENPFVQPYLQITPTNQQLNAYAGLKGKLFDNLSFRINGSYETKENYAFFSSLPFSGQSNRDQGFEYGNAFDIIYDDLETLSFKSSLQFDFSSDLQMGFRAAFNSYSTDNLTDALNLPELTYSFNSSYNINDKWSVSGMIFYQGERNDFAETTNATGDFPLVTIDDYLDVNLHSSYQINEQLAVFIKGNNLLEGNYRRWKDYRVQSLQILGGLRFQFDW